MKSGGVFLVIFGLLALFIASTGRYRCFEQFIVGIFTGNCVGAPGTAGNTGVAGGLSFNPFGSGFIPGGLGQIGGNAGGGGVLPFNFPFGDFPTKSPDFNPFPKSPFDL